MNVQGFTQSRLSAADVKFCRYTISSVNQYRVIVTVTYQHPEFFPLAQIAALAAGQPAGPAWHWTINGSAEMRLEHDLPSVATSCT